MLREARLISVEPDPREPFLPRLREPVPGLGAVADDGEAPGRAAEQQHLPLGVGQLLGLVDDDVRERAGEQVRVGGGQRGLVDQGVPQVPVAQARHQQQLGVVGRDQLVDDVGHALAFGGDGRLLPAPAPGRLRVAEPLPRGVQERQVGDRPGLRVRALQRPDVVGAEPGSAPPQVGGHRPQVADEVGRLEQRPGPVEGREQLPVLLQRLPEQVGRRRRRRAVHQDREQRLPDLVARLVVRGAGVRRLEGLGPVVGAQPDVGRSRSRPSSPCVGGSS